MSAKTLNVCQRYKAELIRLYGQDCAEASTVEPNGQGRYLVSVAMPKGDGFILPTPVAHTEEEIEGIVVNLSKRKGGEGLGETETALG